MNPPVAPQTENIVIILIAIATGVALASRWLRVPYTVALVVAGLTLGTLHAVEAPHLTRELVFALFLPGLVFEAAFHLRYQDVRRDAVPVIALAIPGVGIVLTVTAAALVAGSRTLGMTDGLGWRQALVFGSLIAATDPIAVVALFRSLGAPPRLTMLMEAESLLNDGTAIVCFGLVLAATAGAPIGAATLLLRFGLVVGVGAAVGGVMGYGLCQLSRRIDDPMVEITLTMLAAYGSFALAEQLGGSGVIATVVAGLLCGNYGVSVAMSAATRTAVTSFWAYAAFLLNSVVFLLIGFEVRLSALAAVWPIILLAAGAVLIARVIVIAGTAASVSRSAHRIDAAWIAPLTWGGLRGALSMVLALSLPADFPRRELIVTMTFGVVIVSIIVQGTTMAPLLRRLRLVRKDTATHARR
jgi:CPA1 family monovalent cation:H+ antiporter